MRARYKPFCSSLFIFASISCSPATQESFLADWQGEEQRFFNEACNGDTSSSGPSRLSVIEMNGRSLTILQPDACAKQGKKNSSLGLTDEASRKPVYIHYGYAGNSSGDQLVKRNEQDAIEWAKDNFRVVNVSGMSIDRAQAAIMDDRRRNPSDYSKDSHVFVDIVAHGGVGEKDNIHRIGKNDVTPTSSTISQYRTTDIQKALLEGVGHNAGNVVCMVQSCYAGAIKNDPAFPDLQESKINPDQTRVFMFASAEDQPAVAYGSNAMEQSMLLLTQMGGGEKGLSVSDFENELERKNLGRIVVNSSTVYFTSPAGMSTDHPLGGTLSHYGVNASYASQGPSVVGPRDALILPPGIMPGNSQPVLSEQERREQTNRHASQRNTVIHWSDQ